MPSSVETAQPKNTASQKERNKLNDIYSKFEDCLDMQNKPFRYFDDQSLVEYINNAERRWNGYLPRREENDWRAHVYMQETRNKIIAIASFAASQRLRIEFDARLKNNPIDKELSNIVQGLYDHSMDSEKGDEKFIITAIEDMIKGTVIVYEGYEYRKRKIRPLKTYNWETGEFTADEKEIVDADNCFQKIIDLKDFFIPNWYEPDVQKQDYMIIREFTTVTNAKARYRKFKNISQVEARSPETNKSKYDYWENWQSRVNGNECEILHYYNKWDDEYLIVANGVMLTPLDNPIPFDHKDYPVSKTVFEPMSHDFFYGKSLPQKMMSEQDVLNSLYNMFIDRSHLSALPWFVTSQQDEIEIGEIGPGEVVQLNDAEQFREGKVSSVSSGDVQMMEMIKSNMSKSSVDPIQEGAQSQGTATSVLQAREASIQKMGLFMVYLAQLTYQQAKQRIANEIQFYPKPNKLKKGFLNEIVMEDSILSDGQTGLKIIRLVEKNKAPEGMKDGYIKKKDEVKETGEQVERYYVTPAILKNIDYKIKIIPASSVPETKTLQKAMVLEYANTLAANPEFARMANWEKVFEIINDVFNMEHTVKNNPEEQQEVDKKQMLEKIMEQGASKQGQGGGRPETPDARWKNTELTKEITGTQKPGLRELMQMPPG